jgi:pimeloyl-ACP methyl ester carboxylesterase
MPSNDRSPSASRSASGGCLFAAGVVLGAPLVIAGSWIAYSNFVVDHQVPLPPAIEVERVSFDSSAAGRLSYYVDKAAAGRPVLLIHSVNAAASAYEMRPIFDHYRGQRPLFALDLPGYGFSERTDRAQSPDAFAQAIVI